MKMLSLFSGIGAFEKALDNLGIEYELVGYSEIDKYASKSYAAIHGLSEDKNFGDITKIDETKLPKDIDLITYGFPCQDISVAGKQKGLIDENGKQTRSGLFFEALRIIEATQPKIAIAENVKNLTSKKFNAQFQVVLESLETAGYNNYWKVLNAKDYGIPQNRERVFIVSIRKDVDHGLFEFPKPFHLKKKLKDMLEDEVDEKYYLSSEQVKRIVTSTFSQEKTRIQGDTCQTLLSRDYKGPKCVHVGIDKSSNNTREIELANCITAREDRGVSTRKGEGTAIIQRSHGYNKGGIKEICPSITKSAFEQNNAIIQVGQMYPNSGNPQAGRIYDSKGISPAMDTCQGGNRMPKIVDPFIAASRGRNPENPSDRTAGAPTEQRLEPRTDGVTNTITTVQKDNYVCGTGGRQMTANGMRIRKLTPKECFRLTGFSDEDFEKAEKVNSNSQLYKQAGNSIVVDVLEEIFCQIFGQNREIKEKNND